MRTDNFGKVTSGAITDAPNRRARRAAKFNHGDPGTKRITSKPGKNKKIVVDASVYVRY